MVGVCVGVSVSAIVGVTVGVCVNVGVGVFVCVTVGVGVLSPHVSMCPDPVGRPPQVGVVKPVLLEQ